MSLIPSHAYCTADDMRDVLSSPGVALRIDDNPPDQLGNAIDKGSNRVDFFLARMYDPANLAQSGLVRDWTAILACYYLCVRRGNDPPRGLQIMYEDAINDMTEVKNATNDIPGIARRKSYAPGLSVMRSTLRPFPRAVVETSRSTKAGGTPEHYHQARDPYDTFGWNATAFLDNAW